MRKLIQYIKTLQIDKHRGTNASARMERRRGEMVRQELVKIYTQKDSSTEDTIGGVWRGGVERTLWPKRIMDGHAASNT